MEESLIRRLRERESASRSMFTLGTNSTRLGQAGISNLFGNFGGNKAIKFVESVRILRPNRIGTNNTQIAESMAHGLSDRWGGGLSLLHIKPAAGNGKPVYPEMDAFHPSAERQSAPAKASQGELRAGMTIPSMSPFPKAGQSFEEFKRDVESRKESPTAPRVERQTRPTASPTKAEPPRQTDRIFSRVQELPARKPNTPITAEEKEISGVEQPPIIDEPLGTSEERVEKRQAEEESKALKPSPKPGLKQAAEAKPKPVTSQPKIQRQKADLAQEKPLETRGEQKTPNAEAKRPTVEPEVVDFEVAPSETMVDAPTPPEKTMAREKPETVPSVGSNLPKQPTLDLPRAKPAAIKKDEQPTFVAKPKAPSTDRPRAGTTEPDLKQVENIPPKAFMNEATRTDDLIHSVPRDVAGDRFEEHRPEVTVEPRSGDVELDARPGTTDSALPIARHHQASLSTPLAKAVEGTQPKTTGIKAPQAQPKAKPVVPEIRPEGVKQTRAPLQIQQNPAGKPAPEMPLVKTTSPISSSTASAETHTPIAMPHPSVAPRQLIDQTTTSALPAPATQPVKMALSEGVPQPPASPIPAVTEKVSARVEASAPPTPVQSPKLATVSAAPVVQRMWEEHQEMSSGAGSNGSRDSGSGEAPENDLENLAAQVLPLVKQLLEIENERVGRRSGR